MLLTYAAEGLASEAYARAELETVSDEPMKRWPSDLPWPWPNNVAT